MKPYHRSKEPATTRTRKGRRKRPSTTLQQTFLRRVVPYLRMYGAYRWRHLPPAQREERIGDALGVAWCYWCSYRKRFTPTTIATFAAQTTEAGRFPSANARCACMGRRKGKRGTIRQESARDVLSPQAQRKHGLTVESLELPTQDKRGRPVAFEDLLIDHRPADPADHACFVVDWDRFFRSCTRRERRVIRLRAAGYSQPAIARKIRSHQSAVSLLLSRLADDWRRFQGEIPC